MSYSKESIQKDLYYVCNRDRIIYNSDNARLFRRRYYFNSQESNKRYKKRSLLYHYCVKHTDNNIMAGRLFCCYGNLGILDIVDVIESENYIFNVDPEVFPVNEFPRKYKQIMIDVCNDVKEGINVV